MFDAYSRIIEGSLASEYISGKPDMESRSSEWCHQILSKARTYKWKVYFEWAASRVYLYCKLYIKCAHIYVEKYNIIMKILNIF